MPNDPKIKKIPLAATPRGTPEEQRRNHTPEILPCQAPSYIFVKDAGDRSFTRDPALSNRARALLYAIFNGKTGLRLHKFYSLQEIARWRNQCANTIRARLNELSLFGYARLGTKGGSWVWQFTNVRAFMPPGSRRRPVFRVPEHYQKQSSNITKKMRGTLPKNHPSNINRGKQKKTSSPSETAKPSLSPPGNIVEVCFQQELIKEVEKPLSVEERRLLAEADKPVKEKKPRTPSPTWQFFRWLTARLAEEKITRPPLISKVDQGIAMAQIKNLLKKWPEVQAEHPEWSEVTLEQVWAWALRQNEWSYRFEWRLVYRLFPEIIRDYHKTIIAPELAKADDMRQKEENRKRNEAAFWDRQKKLEQERNSNADRAE